MRISKQQLAEINDKPWRKESGKEVVAPKVKRNPNLPKEASINEEALVRDMKAEKVDGYVREYAFHPERHWRFDFAWPDKKIAVEAEGGTWHGGGHTKHKGYQSNCEKYNAALDLDWKVYRFTSEQITKGIAIDTIKRLVK